MKKQRLQHWILVTDLIWIFLALVVSYLMRYGFVIYPSTVSMSATLIPIALVSAVLWTALFARMKLDGFRLGWYIPAIVSQLFLATCALIALAVAISYLDGHYLSRLLLGYWGTLLFVGFVLIRQVTHAILGCRYFRRTMRRVAIVGNGPVAREMASKIERHPEMLCQVAGYLCSADASLDARLLAHDVKTTTVQTLGVVNLLREQLIDELIITLSKPGEPEIMELARQCRRAGITVSVVPQPYELYLSMPQLLDIGGLPVIRIHEVNGGFANGTAKRVLDIVGTFLLLPLALPVVVVAVLGLGKRHGGTFIRELRCGQFGKPFWMYRLNSDRNSATWAPFERLLEQLSITELPQLLNVIVGDMSLVGPRPETEERVKHYSDWQRQRLNVRPGITGLAQVHGLREQHSSEEKTRFDLQYLLHASPFSDLTLLLQTVWTLARRLPQLKTTGSRQVERSTHMADKSPSRSLSDAHSS